MNDNLSSPLISIIIPVYNVEKYFENCIKSVQNQSYRNIEIIIINDGSTDSTKELCEYYSKTDKRIIVINQKNMGVSAARNAGIKYSNGQYISFVDGDDYIDFDMYEKLVYFAQKYKSDYTITGFKYEKIENHLFLEKSKKITNYQIVFFTVEQALHDLTSLKSEFSRGYVCAKLIVSKIAKSIMFNTNLVYGEDFLFNYQCILKSKKIVAVTGKPYHYLLREDSACGSPISDIKIRNIIKSHDKIEETINKSLNIKLIKRYKIYRIICAELNIANQIILNNYYNSVQYKKIQKNSNVKFWDIVFCDIGIVKKIQLIIFKYFGHLYPSILLFLHRKAIAKK